MKNYEQFARLGANKLGETKDERLNSFALGLCSESGEVAGALLRYQRQYNPRKSVTEHDLLLELGDVMWNLANLCNELNATLDTIQRMNVGKLRARNPEHYSEKDLLMVEHEITQPASIQPTPAELCRMLWSEKN